MQAQSATLVLLSGETDDSHWVWNPPAHHVPAWHAGQDADPAVEENVPSAQVLQDVSPTRLYSPAVHGVHMGPTWPAGHTHAAELVERSKAVVFPSEHGVHAWTDGLVEKKPKPQ
jgi:hypothetical protein